jgi:hypothetical protein
MDKESTTFGLSPEKLTRLLNIGSDVNQSDGDLDAEGKKARLLDNWLAATLPLDAVLIESLPAVIRRLHRQLWPYLGEPFGSLLKNPQIDLLVIRKIKDYSKKLVRSAKSQAEHDAATAIYFAAIAAALLYHDVKITKFSYRNLEESFSALINQKWISTDMTGLFSKASAVCRQKDKRK